MQITIVIPAYNEEKLIAETLASAAKSLAAAEIDGEIIVVDNGSSDKTAEIAYAASARVIEESLRNIAAVRNRGAREAFGDTIFFLDADTRVSDTTCQRIASVMRDPNCMGGSFWVSYGTFERGWMKYYSMGWKFWGKVFNMRQGAAQFCRKSAFEQLGGFDESIFMGEDVDFYWRLDALAKKSRSFLKNIDDVEIVTSPRRFDKMSVLRTLILTHPFFIMLFRKKIDAWKEWYEKPVR
jgi:glycosyltransferase involved in cell wall biosynthesis